MVAKDEHGRLKDEAGQSAGSSLLAVARGDWPADLLLSNGQIVNVFCGQIERADIAIAGDRIAGIGPGYRAREVIDLNGSFVAPGLIDSHVHIESSLCVPGQFASAVVPRGVTTVVTDPHEIANVAGIEGIRFMIQASRGLPLRVVVMASSCVPATDMASSGARLDAGELAQLLEQGEVHGLAEVMNYPGVIAADPQVAAKLQAFCGRPRDGHAPGLGGKALNAYVAAGIGSDHECVSVDEAAEKLARGMYILIRQASTARNLDALLPLVRAANSRRICFCTDDRQPADLLDEGSIDHMVRRAIAHGIDPIEALRMATLNPSEWFGLHDRGAIAPGRLADLIIFDDLANPQARLVYSGGVLAARDGRPCSVAGVQPTAIPDTVRARCILSCHTPNLRVRARSARIRVIGAQAEQLVTEHLIFDATIHDGYVVPDPTRDILKIAVIERHGRGGGIGLGFIHGLGLTRGAIAGTVAHDHHNLIVIGADDESMLTAIRAIVNMGGGGLCAAANQQVLASLPLPVAGLMSDRPITEVRVAYDRLLHAARRDLGSCLRDPFMTMSFMALEVIPKLKLTDKGLVDVENFRFVDLFL
ncbi:adenine deaminase [Fontivita pretiosa]|uniref:adenine deaminase n=1 Tax=Fontivita pretiosa TaxID=2989684 RepID=UPI003D17EB0C